MKIPFRKIFGEPSRPVTSHQSPITITCLFILFLFGCANIVAPTGGPRDTTPPTLDSLNSTPNFQTRFQKQDIMLAFTEWVELKDAFNQIVISPPLEFRPTIERRKKGIHVEFDDREILRDSATYVLNFGKAIVDLTEGNAASMVFVFSTGDYIDSLSLSGKIVDAWTGQPVENVVFMLYENMADSVVRTERPFYFGRTDKEGDFLVQNMKPGKFKGFALLDGNLNYRFDNESEKIGFPDSAVVVSSPKRAAALPPIDSIGQDSTAVPVVDSVRQTSPIAAAPKINIRLFEEEGALYLRSKKKTDAYGQVKLVFNREPSDANIRYDSVGQGVFLEQENDTIRLWYESPDDAAWNVYFQRDTVTDTILVQSGYKPRFLETARLSPLQTAGPPQKVLPNEPFLIKFNHPLATFDASKITLLEDTAKTVVQPLVGLDTTNWRQLSLSFNWKEAVNYNLLLLPGSVTDMFGLSNVDTLRRTFSVAQGKDLGVLTLKINGLRADTNYVVRVLDKSGKAVRTFTVIGPEPFRQSIPALLPDTYTIETIEDLDQNGRWTSGNYDLRRQPERVTRKKLEELRANWELDADVTLDFEKGESGKRSESGQKGERGGREK